MTWLKKTSDGVTISVRVIPRANTNKIDGLHGDALKIRLQAPPVDGKANAVLIRFLADYLEISAAQIQILHGQTGRNKVVSIHNISPEDAKKLLE